MQGPQNRMHPGQMPPTNQQMAMQNMQAMQAQQYMHMQKMHQQNQMLFNMQQQQQMQKQKEQAHQTLSKKFGYKPSLSAQCEKHQNQIIIFEDGENKYCEKCYVELEIKSKQDLQTTGAGDTDTQNEALNQFSQQQNPNQEQNYLQGGQQLSKQQQVLTLQTKLSNLLQSLSDKIREKANHLILSHEQLIIYEKTLAEKYDPVFGKMKEITQEKQLDYMTFLLKQLNQNRDRIQLEKVTLEKLMKSFYDVGEKFSPVLEQELKIIEEKDKESQKIVQKEQEQAKQNYSEEDDKEEDIQESSAKVDGYKIESVNTMIEDFDNIIAKNICVYTNYEDFSFAQTRNKEQLEENFKSFVQKNFSGDFQIQNWFNQEVLPRLHFLQQKTKFIYTYKILHFNTECQLIQNSFVFPEKGRHIVTPEGQLYFNGGFFSNMKIFSKNNFILDEHRQLLVPHTNMSEGRADHALLNFKGQIYTLGGMSYTDPAQKTTVQSLNSCEVYDIKEDKWQTLPPFKHARQAFGVCPFNDKYIFIFGGKVLRPGQNMVNILAYEFVSEVECYDIDRNNWRVINYISENNKLRILHPGTVQISGKKIMIFGGIIPPVEHEEDHQALENDQRITVSNQNLQFNVTNGELKRGQDLAKPFYCINGGSICSQQGKIYALGFGISKESSGFGFLSGESQQQQPHTINELNPNMDKKVLQCYKAEDDEWTEIQEGLFTGQRKRSLEDNLEEMF